MNLGLYIGLGVGLGILVLVAIIILLKRKKVEKNPLISRAEDTIIIINQRIISIDSRIQKNDEDITRLVAAKEKNDTSLLDEGISLDNIPNEIENKKTEINEFIADIKDLEEYKMDIEELLSEKEETKWEKLETVLNQIKEKLKYRFI